MAVADMARTRIDCIIHDHTAKRLNGTDFAMQLTNSRPNRVNHGLRLINTRDDFPIELDAIHVQC